MKAKKKARPKNTYRCSCCDCLRDETDMSYAPWTKSCATPVGVCASCRMTMVTLKIRSVKKAVEAMRSL